MQDFITLEDLEGFLSEDLEAGAQLFVDAAQAAARARMDQTITRETTTEIHTGNGRGRLRLWERPIRGIIEVKIEGRAIDPAKYEVLLLDRAPVLVLINDRFGRGLRVDVTYDHGWDVGLEDSDSFLPVPADLKVATLSLAASMWGDDNGDGQVQGESIGGYSYTRDTAGGLMSSAQREVFDAYAIRRVP